jgi:putative copper resistance protein D
MFSLAGAIFFAACVAEPTFRSANYDGGVASALRSRLASIIWISLLAGFASACAWLILLAARLADVSVASVVSGPPLWMVLTETDFGEMWGLRLLLMLAFATTLLLFQYQHSFHRSGSMRIVSVAFAGGLVGTLAWAGHAAANMGSDLKGSAHLAGDVLHLIAAAAWVGALVPLAMLLNVARRDRSEPMLHILHSATLRFSTLGVVSVGTIFVSGLNNTWVLAGSLYALTSTDYGRLLLLKLVLFAGMLGIATVNRFRLTPQLIEDKEISAAAPVARRLQRNALVEASLGVLILIIVAALGTMSPGLDDMGMRDLCAVWLRWSAA